ncbi:MAG: hypothetical protein PHW25_06170 [Zoogloea sp.]|uniref:hypothetical protein n=1 Tax=Zoogloea sp. TaxID=49181 RepID=UPI002606985D|nr:hypothetical protein [Zoogloea sp.]MDD3326652.1 hypothetical protein [Zoogloea sp.]
MKPTTREFLASHVASRSRPAIVHIAQSDLETQAAEELKTSGITMLGELLTSAQCAELREYFKQHEVFDPYRKELPRFQPMDVKGKHPDAHVAHHSAKDILQAPYLADLANDPRILAIVSRFLGCRPTIGYLATWWSYATEKGAQEAEFFHRDVDDWKFVKLFVYLSDVGESSGPHIYVRNSSNKNKLAEIRRFSDREVADTFGEENILRLKANAGQGFLEDTFGIHKGQPVAKGTRLIFQAVYGLSPLPYGPRSPIMSKQELNRPGFDAWVNRIYVS